MEGHTENLNKYPVLGREYSFIITKISLFTKSTYKFKAISMNSPFSFSFQQLNSRYLENSVLPTPKDAG